MNSETFLSIALVIVLLLGLAGAAYFLQKRSKQSGPIGGPEFQIKHPAPGPITKTLTYISRGLLVVMVLSTIGGFLFSSMILFYIAGGCLLLGLILGQVHRIAIWSGK
jgi:hypothetical protein